MFRLKIVKLGHKIQTYLTCSFELNQRLRKTHQKPACSYRMTLRRDNKLHFCYSFTTHLTPVSSTFMFMIGQMVKRPQPMSSRLVLYDTRTEGHLKDGGGQSRTPASQEHLQDSALQQRPWAPNSAKDPHSDSLLMSGIRYGHFIIQ